MARYTIIENINYYCRFLPVTQRAFWLYFAISVLLIAQPACAKPQLTAWDSFVNDFIEGYFKLQPAFAVNTGRHEFDGKLPNWSPEGIRKNVEWLESQRQLVTRYQDQSQHLKNSFEQDYLLSVIDGDLFWLKSAEAPFKNPMFYANSLDPNVYVNRPYVPIDQRLRAFIDYSRNIPKASEEIRANLRLPLPRTYIEMGALVFNGLAKFYENDAKTVFNSVKSPQLQAQNNEASKAAAKAMRELANWLESQCPKATENFALGEARFREMLKATEGIDLPLTVLEKAGRDDLQRNLDALKATCKRYAPTASIPGCVTQTEAIKPQGGAVAAAGEQLASLKAFLLDKDLVSIPSQVDATVAESPPYKRWNPAYIDIPGPFEHNLPATYYVAPPDPAWSPEEQAAYVPGKANLLFISVHEVWPGHFLQFLHAHRVKSKIGQLFGSYAFAEGWAHYAEELMWEAGLNLGDDEAHIGQLLNALIRNVRFLTAIGLHTQGMSVAESEKMFRELAFRDAANARQQAARGTFDPAYLNYTLGKLLIHKLRSKWTASRGGNAAWKQFHDTFLSYGSPPIPLLWKAMLNTGKSPTL